MSAGFYSVALDLVESENYLKAPPPPLSLAGGAEVLMIDALAQPTLRSQI